MKKIVFLIAIVFLIGCGEISKEEVVTYFDSYKSRDFNYSNENEIQVTSSISENKIIENNISFTKESYHLSSFSEYLLKLPTELSISYNNSNLGFSIIIRDENPYNIFYFRLDRINDQKEYSYFLKTEGILSINLENLYHYNESRNELTVLFYKEVGKESEAYGFRGKPIDFIATRLYIFKTIIDLNDNTIEYIPYAYITKYQGDTIETVYID